MPPTRARQLSALLVTILLPCLMCAGLVLVVERPFWRFDQQAFPHRRAAVALRDDVIPFQKWGTKVFTLPYLEHYYEYTAYFTQSPDDTTQQAFIATLTQALTEYDTVDLFLLAHSNRYIDWVATIDPACGPRYGWSITLGATTQPRHRRGYSSALTRRWRIQG